MPEILGTPISKDPQLHTESLILFFVASAGTAMGTRGLVECLISFNKLKTLLNGGYLTETLVLSSALSCDGGSEPGRGSIGRRG